MLTIQTFLLGVLVVSVFTGLVTEGVKKIMTEHNKSYYSNTLAGIISLVLAICLGVGYLLLNNMAFDTPAIVYLIALVFASWLCAMVGYDKVIQAIAQVKTYGRGDGNE